MLGFAIGLLACVALAILVTLVAVEWEAMKTPKGYDPTDLMG